jgi:DNA-binding LytR/AlgR family response regulator
MTPQPLLWHGRLAFRTSNIVRLEAARNYTVFFMQDGRQLLTSHTLAYYEAMLPSCFVRVHRSHYVNLYYVKSLGCRLRSCVLLNDGKEVPIARRRATELRKNFKIIIQQKQLSI